MSSYPKKVRLGSDEVEFRPATASDEEALVKFFSTIPEGDRLFLKEDVNDPAVIKRWMSNIDLDRIFPLLALHKGEVVGDGTLHRNPFGWSRHVGEIRAVVSPQWQHKGVGKALVHELVARAVDVGLEILEAHVLEGQHGAQRAFEGLGFHSETILKGRAKDQNGQKRNVLVMTNDVNELWRRMEDIIMDLEHSPSGY